MEFQSVSLVAKISEGLEEVGMNLPKGHWISYNLSRIMKIEDKISDRRIFSDVTKNVPSFQGF